MIIGFKPQFVKKILRGSKKHTIREDKFDRWRPGKSIHFATGVRTKNYKQFKKGICKSVQWIKINYWKGNTNRIQVLVDDKIMFEINGIIHEGTDFMDDLAKNDGFKNYDELLDWFCQGKYGVFFGKIIHWTDLKYSPEDYR